ncbi:MAG: hypothetical protein OER04_01205 [Cyclobacteriaceae bacterium]|nr:hypothetical protein [Cyclobacteriaceae bacterium]
MRNILLIIFCFWIGPYLTQAQDVPAAKSNHPYLGLTLGLASIKVKDDLVMPVRYRGTNFNFKLNYIKSKPLSIQEVYINGVIGGVKTKQANVDNFGSRFIEPRAQLYWADIGYNYLHEFSVINSEQYRFFMGGNAYIFGNVRYNERWDNSVINYEGALVPLSWTGRVERSIITKKKEKLLTFSYSLNFPILAFVIRPEFSGVPDFLDHEASFLSDMFQRGSWESFWGFPRIKSTLDLTMQLSANNLMKFTYTWDYYSYQDPVRTQSAGHFFTFTLLTHL